MALINISNEYSKLLRVALYRPRVDEIFQGNPKEAMYISRPDLTKVLREFDGIVAAFRKLGIEVVVLQDTSQNTPTCNNLIYLRDVASIINQTVIIAQMKHETRRHDPDKFVSLSTELGVRPAELIHLPPEQTMEGADILVLSDNSICAYTGYRTSGAAVKSISTRMNLRTMDVPARVRTVPQHLLGAMHILGPALVVRRPELCSVELPGYRAIDLPESSEVTEGFAMNIVTVAPNEVLMPAGCPEVKEKLTAAGVTCHTVQISEIHKMGGGLACMTLPLQRKAK